MAYSKNIFQKFARRGGFFEHHSFMEAVGWAIMAFGVMLSAEGYLNNEALSFFAAPILILGLWLVSRERDFWGLSDSTKQLHHETRAARSSHAVHLHGVGQRVQLKEELMDGVELLKKNAKRSAVEYIVFLFLTFIVTTLLVALGFNQIIQSSLALILSLLVMGFIISRKQSDLIISAGIFLVFFVLALSTSFWFGTVGVIVLSLVAIISSMSFERFKIYQATVIAFYLTMLRWVIYYTQADNIVRLRPVEDWITQWGLLAISTVVMSMLFVFPFILKRRKIEHTETIKGIFIANYVGLLGLSAYLVQPILSDRSLSSYLASLIMIVVALGMIAWMAYGRYSYAKYFYGIAVAMAAMIGFLNFDSIFVTVWIISMAVIISTVGFALKSYSARLMGYLLTAFAYMYYIFNVLPLCRYSTNVQEIISIIWLGLVFAVQLLVLGHWIKELPDTTSEKDYKDWLYGAIYIATYILMFGLINAYFIDYGVSVVWFMLAIIGYFTGYIKRNGPLMLLAQTTVMIALIKIIFFDTVAASLWAKIGLPILIAVSGVLLTMIRVENNKLTIKKRK